MGLNVKTGGGVMTKAQKKKRNRKEKMKKNSRRANRR